MRGVSLVAVLAAMLIQTPSASPQVNQEVKSGDLYVLAMRATLETRANAYSSIGSKDYVNVFIEERVGVTERLPKQLGPFTLTVLNGDGMRRRFKEVGKFPFLSLSPMTNTGSQFVVNVRDQWFSYRRGILFFRRASYIYELEGGTEVKFHYEPAGGDFIVEQARAWGI